MSTPIVRRRKRPVEVDTIQWTGTNALDVVAFTGPENLMTFDDEVCADDPDATAAVFDKLHSTWVLVYTGQHIVRGVKGELYPIAEDVLAETYELADVTGAGRRPWLTATAAARSSPRSAGSEDGSPPAKRTPSTGRPAGARAAAPPELISSTTRGVGSSPAADPTTLAPTR